MSWIFELSPAFFLLVPAAILPLAGRFRRFFLLAGPLAAVWSSWQLQNRAWMVSIPGSGALSSDPLGSLFALIFCIAAVLGALYCLHYDGWGEQAAALALAAGAVGAVLAKDWITLFIFWEGMTVASLFLIWMGGRGGSRAAGLRYLLVHAAGGGLFLAGILFHLHEGGSMALRSLHLEGAASWLILCAVCLNAAVPPLNAWLTDAYPACSPAGSVFQSVFTTKTAVCVLIKLFPGADVLVALGVAMALYGVVFAVLENDIRRLLAYHIVSQVGYMVAGVGIGSVLSLDGSAAHAFCHILYKSLLFMGAGAVVEATGRGKLTELGGLAARMPVIFFLYMVGAFAISGAPLLNGFISKSMIISAAGESHYAWAEALLILASVGTFLHTGLKLPYFTFMGPRREMETRPLPFNITAAMALGALLCFVTGTAPSLLYAMLPNATVYHPYTGAHVVGALEILAGTAIGFWLLRAKLGGESTVTLDTDWFYRRPLVQAVMGISLFLRSWGAQVEKSSRELTDSFLIYADSLVFLKHPAPVGLILLGAVIFFILISLSSRGIF